MKTKLKKFATGAAVAGLIISGGAATASAAAQYVGGGRVYSDYYHQHLRHGSSVQGRSGLVQSPCTDPGHWSKASDNTKRFGGNQSFWRHC